jgi:hypothetical protein
MLRLTRMNFVKLAIVIFASVAPVWPQAGQLKTADAVLDRYKHALGGADAIAKVQSLTIHGEFEGTGRSGKASLVYYAKPFKTLVKVTRDDGTEGTSGFDGSVSWSIDSQGATIDKDTALEPCAGMPTCNLRSTSPTISKTWTSAESWILKGAAATGYTAPPIGARTIISSMMAAEKSPVETGLAPSPAHPELWSSTNGKGAASAVPLMHGNDPRFSAWSELLASSPRLLPR